MSNSTTSAQPIIAIGGSRRLSPAGQDLAHLVTQRLLQGGLSLVVGCATGADAAVIAAALAAKAGPRLGVLSAFGPVTGRPASFAVAGAGSCSAIGAVAAAG